MKALILGLQLPPEGTSIGPYTADLAEYLKSAGHDVRVITGFPTAPQWKVWDGYEGKRFMRETVKGVRYCAPGFMPEEPAKDASADTF